MSSSEVERIFAQYRGVLGRFPDNDVFVRRPAVAGQPEDAQ